MLGWDSGYVVYATTIYWYGDYNSEAQGTSGIDEAKRQLLPKPPNPADYKVENSIEFEDLKYSAKSPRMRVETQSMMEFPAGKWSRAKHLICSNIRVGDFVEFTFDDIKDEKCRLELYATKANDYGKVKFYVNDKPAGVIYDGYNDFVTNSKPIILGTFSPVSGKIKLKAEIVGTNEKSRGVKYQMAFDCIRIIPVK